MKNKSWEGRSRKLKERQSKENKLKKSEGKNNSSSSKINHNQAKNHLGKNLLKNRKKLPQKIIKVWKLQGTEITRIKKASIWTSLTPNKNQGNLRVLFGQSTTVRQSKHPSMWCSSKKIKNNTLLIQLLLLPRKTNPEGKAKTCQSPQTIKE